MWLLIFYDMKPILIIISSKKYCLNFQDIQIKLLYLS